jgi:hypothetical protein
LGWYNAYNAAVYNDNMFLHWKEQDAQGRAKLDEEHRWHTHQMINDWANFGLGLSEQGRRWFTTFFSNDNGSTINSMAYFE